MTAEEARKKAIHYNTNIMSSQYKEIINEIEKESSLGKYKVYHNDYMNDDVAKKLQEDGFVIKSVGRYNEIMHEISWKNN